MPKPRRKAGGKVPKLRSNKTDWLPKALAKLTKEELVEIVIAAARNDGRLRQALEARFPSDFPGRDLVEETVMAISRATDFDDREIGQNFDYDYEAYEKIERNFRKLVNSGKLTDAMPLALKLMREGSYQAEMSDESLMSDDLERALRVVIDAVDRAEMPAQAVITWCQEMVKADRLAFLCRSELEGVLKRRGARRRR